MSQAAPILFLLLVMAAGICWGAVAAARVPLNWPQRLVYFTATLFARFQWRASVIGRWTLPDGVGAVVVANHTSSVDPMLIQQVTCRGIHWMVAREFLSIPGYGWLLRTTDTIPAGRGGVDTASTKQAIRYAQEGKLVGVLPEGRINQSDDLLLPVRPGAVLIALRARVPIVPCYVENAPFNRVVYSPLFMRSRVRIYLGQPIDLSPWYDQASDTEQVKQLTRRVVREITRLAGQPEYEVRLAGRSWKPGSEQPADAPSWDEGTGDGDLVGL